MGWTQQASEMQPCDSVYLFMRLGVGSSFQSTEFLFVFSESVSICVPGWVRTRLLQTQQRAACFCLSMQGLKVCDPLPCKKFLFLICSIPHKSLLELESDFLQWTLGLCYLKQQKKHLYYLEEKFSRERDLAGWKSCRFSERRLEIL